ncbi:hypothetical protein Tco_0645815 [Tanacetum coccineum]
MGKRKPDKNRCITVNLFHGGVLTVPPFEYAHSDEKQITDVHFEGMSFVQFRKVIRNLVQGLVANLYYGKVDIALRIGIKPLKNDTVVDQFVILAYQNKWEVNLYVEHNGYNALDIRDQGETKVDDEDNESSDAYCSSDDEDLCCVDFHTEADDNVVIKTLSINDPFLNPEFNVKQGITYLRHDPTQDWNKIEPVLGIRFEHPEQLKLCLANYGVANGYQLWYKRNDRRKVLVYCGKDVEAGRCTGRSRSKTDEGTSKYSKTPMKAITSREGCSESSKWTKSNIKGHKKSSCKKEPVPKPPKVNRRVLPKTIEYRTYASARGRGRGSRGGRGGRGEGSATMGEGNDGMSETGGAGGRSQKGRGRGQRERKGSERQGKGSERNG